MNRFEYRREKEDKKIGNIKSEIGGIIFGLTLLFGILTTLDYCGINIGNGNKIVDLVFMIICGVYVGFIFFVILIFSYVVIRYYFIQKKQEQQEKKNLEE